MVVDLREERRFQWTAEEVLARMEHATTIAVRYMLLPGRKQPTPRWPRWLISVSAFDIERPLRFPDHIAPATLTEMEDVLSWPGVFLVPKKRPAQCLKDWLRCKAKDKSFSHQARKRGMTAQAAAHWRNVGCEIIADRLEMCGVLP